MSCEKANDENNAQATSNGIIFKRNRLAFITVVLKLKICFHDVAVNHEED